METTRVSDKQYGPGEPEKKSDGKKRSKRGNPAQALLRAKRKLDDVMTLLGEHSDLRNEASELRKGVLARFVEEEEKAAPRLPL